MQWLFVSVIAMLATSAGCQWVAGYQPTPSPHANAAGDAAIGTLDQAVDRPDPLVVDATSDADGAIDPDAPAAPAEGGPSGDSAPGADAGTVAHGCPVDPALVACYLMDGSGATVTDGSSYGNHGTIQGAATRVAGVSNTAISFPSGGPAFVEVPATPSLDLTGPLTIEMWLNTQPVPSSLRQVLRRGLGGSHVFLGANGTDTYVNCTTGLTGFFATIPTSTWVHVACTYDTASSERALYLDGVRAIAGAGNPPQSDPSAVMMLGSNASGGGIEGMLDTLRIWSGVRTDAQICAAAQRSFSAGQCQ